MREEIFAAAAIDRFIRAHKRVQNLSAGLSDDDVIIAYEERTEALLALIRWDKADPIAAAILALVRAQDRLQGHYDGISVYRDLTPDQEREEHDRADADRKEAILALMAVARPAEDYHGRAQNLVLFDPKRAGARKSSAHFE
jgi:hypothetical protein